MILDPTGELWEPEESDCDGVAPIDPPYGFGPVICQPEDVRVYDKGPVVQKASWLDFVCESRHYERVCDFKSAMLKARHSLQVLVSQLGGNAATGVTCDVEMDMQIVRYTGKPALLIPWPEHALPESDC